ncbi:arsenate reductase ArsC [Iodobacter fluviatilis]|uniref:Arsenate reductase n=1 Tax=Iodobacter fluviatilis TaxID=537 RepID=A0A377QA16_9NEIS|nr:arsenate reductase ArsC [Iodobacter fluviatilis]TCU81912.1 arsenate reductase [Iodobacter fluviatilis]STQ91555.1 Arsenate reductase [Iodobacter fluviatilis]
MSNKVYNVLFLCTANSARSVMSEGWLNMLGKGRFKAFSAGSHPSGQVNPYAITLLNEIGYDTSALRSKSWEEFEAADAPHMDIVITVCDNAKGELCPIWPGHPLTAHWGYEDPHGETEEEKQASFRKVFLQIKQRVLLLASLPDEKLASLALKDVVRDIGESKLD